MMDILRKNIEIESPSSLVKIRGFADAARAPIEFTLAPSDALRGAFLLANCEQQDIQYYETNEAIALVALVHNLLLTLDAEQ